MEAEGTAQGSGGGGLLVGSVSAMSEKNTECLQKCMREGVGSLAHGPAAVSSWNLQETGGHLHAHPGQDGHLGLRCFTQSPVSLSVRVLCPESYRTAFHSSVVDVYTCSFLRFVQMFNEPRYESCNGNMKINRAELGL